MRMAKKNLDYDIGAAFEAIENELMASMIRNMQRHKVEEVDEDKQWTMWQTEMLKSLEQYKKKNQAKYSQKFKDINAQIEALIRAAKDEGEMDQEAFEAFRKKFADAIRDDLNTSMALTIVYDVVKADISEKTKLALLNDFDQVLALNLTTAGQERLDAGTSVDAELEQFINEKIAERAGAKKAKDFARADAIRDELLARGITIKDTREGVVWERNA